MDKTIRHAGELQPAEQPRVPYDPPRYDEAELLARGERFCETLARRRSLRNFDPGAEVPFAAIEAAVRAAASAPSGANKQPWTFVVVDDPVVKRRIREAAEEQERRLHTRTATAEFLEDLAPLSLDWHKPFLEEAPYLIVLFAQSYELRADGTRGKHYYVTESAAIAAGILIAALTEMGLSTLTYTPSPMRFIGRLLGRPPNERALLVLPVGYPPAGATVPALSNKDLSEVLVRNVPAVNGG